MKRSTFIIFLLFLMSLYDDANPSLTLIGEYTNKPKRILFHPVDPEVIHWQQKYYLLRIQYKQILHEVSQKNKNVWSLFQKTVHTLREENKNALSHMEKDHKRQLNHERWFQNFLYTSLFTFGIVTYKTLLDTRLFK